MTSGKARSVLPLMKPDFLPCLEVCVSMRDLFRFLVEILLSGGHQQDQITLHGTEVSILRAVKHSEAMKICGVDFRSVV